MREIYPTDPGRAAEALPRWLETQRSLDLLGPGLVEQVPEDWGARPFAGLRAFLLDPVGSEIPAWWLETEPRRESLARLARGLGEWRVADGASLEAIQVWQRGRDIAPPGSPAWIDLTADLARILDQSPELDPDGRQFALLERELFDNKGGAIISRDYAAMRRFHATLGTIYARRGQWGSSGGARGAIFQLSHAIEAAGARERETGIHEPLPELRRLLAEAFRATDQDRRAATAYLQAAQDHLEVGGLDAARELLSNGTRLGSDSEIAARAGRLTRWLEWREQVNRAVTSREGCSAALLDAVVADRREFMGTDDDVATRERFRVLTACGSLGGRAASALHAAALDELLGDPVPLVGIADLTRLEDAVAAVYRAFGQRPPPLDVSASPGAGGAVVPLFLDGRGLFIATGPAPLTAARVVRALRPADNRLRLHIDGRDVRILDPGALGREEVTRRLRAVVGVGTVSGS